MNRLLKTVGLARVCSITCLEVVILIHERLCSRLVHARTKFPSHSWTEIYINQSANVVDSWRLTLDHMFRCSYKNKHHYQGRVLVCQIFFSSCWVVLSHSMQHTCMCQSGLKTITMLLFMLQYCIIPFCNCITKTPINNNRLYSRNKLCNIAWLLISILQ